MHPGSWEGGSAALPSLPGLLSSQRWFCAGRRHRGCRQLRGRGRARRSRPAVGAWGPARRCGCPPPPPARARQPCRRPGSLIEVHAPHVPPQPGGDAVGRWLTSPSQTSRSHLLEAGDPWPREIHPSLPSCRSQTDGRLQGIPALSPATQDSPASRGWATRANSTGCGKGFHPSIHQCANARAWGSHSLLRPSQGQRWDARWAEE